MSATLAIVQLAIVFISSCIEPMLCLESPKLTMDLLGSGFHRDLKYVVVFPDLQGHQNTFLIQQPLPAGVYVSTDQLDDLQRLEKIQYYIAREVDIEKPTEASPEFEILIYGNTAFMQTISLPIHFRYHAPAHKSFVSVGIDYPKLLLQSTENLQPLNATKREMHKCLDRQHYCRWTAVEYDNFSRRTISANIPIGNASLSATVTFCTIALSWVASSFIIYELWKKYKILRVRLTTKLLKTK